MMTMSPAPISVEQALDYYRQEYTNAKEITTAKQAQLRAAGAANWPRNGT